MDVDQLYQEKILAFARAARASQSPDGYTLSASVSNPACGDRVTVHICLDDHDHITEIGAQIEGCALCEAGTGYLLSLARGRHRDEFNALHRNIKNWLNKSDDDVIDDNQNAFLPVREFSSRHTCVCLPFEAIIKAVSEAE